MGVPCRLRSNAADQPVHALVHQERNAGIGERHLDVRSLTRFLRCVQGSKYPDRGKEPGREVSNGNTRLDAFLRIRTGDAQNSSVSLDDEVHSRPGSPAAVASVAADRAIDEAWIGRSQPGGIDAHPLGRSRQVVLDNHIRFGCELLREPLVFGILQIQRQ